MSFYRKGIALVGAHLGPVGHRTVDDRAAAVMHAVMTRPATAVPCHRSDRRQAEQPQPMATSRRSSVSPRSSRPPGYVFQVTQAAPGVVSEMSLVVQGQDCFG